LSLPPLQGEILRMLEEAGEETTETIVVTLSLDLQELSRKEWHRAVRDAVEGLARLGFVSVVPAAGGPLWDSVVLTAAGREALRR
jgi:hypothetical protein